MYPITQVFHYPILLSNLSFTLKTNTKDSSFVGKYSNYVTAYLINTCGLSLQAAASVSKKLNFETTLTADTNLIFFQEYGFSDAQISKIITKRPNLLVANKDRILQPKLEFLKQVGFSDSEIVKYVSSNPSFLCRSLENRIIPSYNYLKTLLLTNETVAIVMRDCSWNLSFDIQDVMTPKIPVLRHLGVPESNIRKSIMRYPRIFTTENSLFNKRVEKACELGFQPSSMLFFEAIYATLVLPKGSSEAKLEIFRCYGFSEDEIISIFKRKPMCVVLSEKKLSDGLNFFINIMNFEPSYLIKYASLLGMSLKKRIIPRQKVVQHLLSKGLVSDKVNFGKLLHMSNAEFYKSFVNKFEKDAPELLSLYQGN